MQKVNTFGGIGKLIKSFHQKSGLEYNEKNVFSE